MSTVFTRVLTGAVNKAAQCLASLSIIMTGIVTAECPLKNILKDKRFYPMLRMTVVPLVTGTILRLFFDPSVV